MLFDAFDLAAQAVLETVMAEPWLFLPRLASPDVNAGFIADLGRKQRLVSGVYSEKNITTNLTDAWDIRTDKRPGASYHTHLVDIDPRTNGDVDIRKGDILVRQRDKARWVVVSPSRDSAGRLLLKVERVS